MRRFRHVNHLLSRYAHGQLRPAQRTRVSQHVRRCEACRAALAREQLIAADLRRQLPQWGQAQSNQLAGVWLNVWQEVNRPRCRAALPAWMPGLGVVVGMLLVLVVALPLIAGGEIRAVAAPNQALPVSTQSPTPGAAVTDEARLPALTGGSALALPEPQATIALAVVAGASPAPQPQATVSPEASVLGAGQ
jgi:predicted anti-sigma-YlaC factor YlaD